MRNLRPLDDVLETLRIEAEVKRLGSIAKRLDRRQEWSMRWRTILNASIRELLIQRRMLLDKLREVHCA